MIIDLRTQFTCGHCGTDVPVPTAEDGNMHNHCPECLWSKHVGFGMSTAVGLWMMHTGNHSWDDNGEYEIPADLLPFAEGCDAMMEPVRVFEDTEFGRSVRWRCEGCGFVMQSTAERYVPRARLTLPKLLLSVVLDMADAA